MHVSLLTMQSVFDEYNGFAICTKCKYCESVRVVRAERNNSYRVE